MSHSHSHHIPKEALADVVSKTTKWLVLAFLAVVALATAVGILVLWPSSSAIAEIRSSYPQNAPGVSYHKAKIVDLENQCLSQQSKHNQTQQINCITAKLRLLSGPEADQQIYLELAGPPAEAGLKSGDTIEVMRVPNQDSAAAGSTHTDTDLSTVSAGIDSPDKYRPPTGMDTINEPTGSLTGQGEQQLAQAQYSYVGVDRGIVILVLAIVFAVAVLLVARWKGLFAIFGLAVSALVLNYFVLPAAAVGKSGVAVGVIGSIAIIFVVIYIAHGFSIRTSTALVSTIIGLLLSAGLGVIAVSAGKLAGYTDETDMLLKSMVPGISMRDLMICAVVIAGLGVLNDVTITQVSAVWELRAAGPSLSRAQIYRAGMRIGRDHIASTIYTIVFAYAGAALVSLVSIALFYDRSLVALLNVELFGGEVLRTLASATGLVLTVPITTAIAAACVRPAKPTAK